MFCPFRKAEYRQGFSTCGDCLIPLVATQAQAAAVEVDRLWTPDDREKFEGILVALFSFKRISEIAAQALDFHTMVSVPGAALHVRIGDRRVPRGSRSG